MSTEHLLREFYNQMYRVHTQPDNAYDLGDHLHHLTVHKLRSVAVGRRAGWGRTATRNARQVPVPARSWARRPPPLPGRKRRRTSPDGGHVAVASDNHRVLILGAETTTGLRKSRGAI